MTTTSGTSEQQTSQRKAVILSVDDEVNIQKSVKRCLRKLDAKVLTASSGEEALTLIDTHQVDVVISDMRMPGMNGAELLARVKKHQPNSSRILLTGYSDADAAAMAVNEGGITRYLSKPWDDDELRQVVDEAIRHVHLENDNKRLQAELQAQHDDLELQVAERTADLQRSNDMLSQAVTDLADSYETMVELLANMSSMPNPEPETVEKKVQLALAMAEAMGLDSEAMVTLKHAIRLHRIGWNALPRKITAIPTDALTATQRKEFEQHPLFGEALLMSVPKLAGVAKLLRTQHEAYDGSGYPDRARTAGIPPSAQILAVARDYYDLQRGRIDKDELSAANAAERIREGSGSVYDPEIVGLFEQVLPKLDRVGAALSEVRVEPRALQPDMILSRDLTTPQGAMLLAKGAVLTPQLIDTIINLEQRSDVTLAVYIRHHNEKDEASL